MFNNRKKTKLASPAKKSKCTDDDTDQDDFWESDDDMDEEEDISAFEELLRGLLTICQKLSGQLTELQKMGVGTKTSTST